MRTATGRVRYRFPPLERRGVIAGWRAGQVGAVAVGLVLAVLAVRSRPSLGGRGRRRASWWARRWPWPSGPSPGGPVSSGSRSWSAGGGPGPPVAGSSRPPARPPAPPVAVDGRTGDPPTPGTAAGAGRPPRCSTGSGSVDAGGRRTATGRAWGSSSTTGPARSPPCWPCGGTASPCSARRTRTHRVAGVGPGPGVAGPRGLGRPPAPVGGDLPARRRRRGARPPRRPRRAGRRRAGRPLLPGPARRVVAGHPPPPGPGGGDRAPGPVGPGHPRGRRRTGRGPRRAGPRGGRRADRRLAGVDIGVDGVLDRAGLAGVLAEALGPGARRLRRGDRRAGDRRRHRGRWAPRRGGTRCAPTATWHATYWVAEWPRVDVQPDFLGPLLFAPLRRTLSVVMEPVDPARAARQVAQARTAGLADGELRRRNGFLTSARHTRERQSVDERDVELADGHAQFRLLRLPRGDGRHAGRAGGGVRRPRAGGRPGPTRGPAALRPAGRRPALPAPARPGPVVSLLAARLPPGPAGPRGHHPPPVRRLPAGGRGRARARGCARSAATCWAARSSTTRSPSTGPAW